MEIVVPVGAPVALELVLRIVQKDVVDAMMIVKPSAVMVVHRVPAVPIVLTMVLADVPVVMQSHVPTVVCNLVMHSVNIQDVTLVLAFVPMDVPINVVTVRATVLAVVLVPPSTRKKVTLGIIPE